MTPATPALDAAFVASALGEMLQGRAGDAAGRPFRRAVVDSREAGPGDLFVALPGQHRDGHEFAREAVRAGAAGVLLARPVEGLDQAARFFVEDPLAALQRLAATWRAALPGTVVIGITGNVGKTTTKLMTAAVLRARYRVHAAANNYNNEIGVPLCLLALGPEVERAVVEMGMYTTGEIAELARWARPRTGVVLNVGPVHLESAGSLERIARAKRELVEALPADGDAILNVDDPRVEAMAEHTAARVWRIGRGESAAVRAVDVEGSGAAGFSFTLVTSGPAPAGSRRVRVPTPGVHLVPNVLAAAGVALAEGLAPDEVACTLGRLQPGPRLLMRELPGGVTLLDDSYSAGPAATIAALDLLSELAGRRIALLGDMRELGELSDALHRDVGRRAGEVADRLVTVGELGRAIADAALEAGAAPEAVRHAGSTEEAVEVLARELRPGDVLLVKGSRALALERVVEALAGRDR
ncbi:MAG: UDP-N-acetylmuramoyl-tripeptide--D-alanyl-D-alanine ligase [Chloroflexi bacterium]|nr:UDP-N-acetylmuramoyl-tripeptide--D-alanyl-D-alanine ligase [Chloroflexota bacterium]